MGRVSAPRPQAPPLYPLAGRGVPAGAATEGDGSTPISTTLQYEHLVKRDLESMVGESEKETLAELGT